MSRRRRNDATADLIETFEILVFFAMLLILANFDSVVRMLNR